MKKKLNVWAMFVSVFLKAFENKTMNWWKSYWLSSENTFLGVDFSQLVQDNILETTFSEKKVDYKHVRKQTQWQQNKSTNEETLRFQKQLHNFKLQTRFVSCNVNYAFLFLWYHFVFLCVVLYVAVFIIFLIYLFVAVF